MIAFSIIVMFTLFQVKHLVLDWLYQPKWMYANKGTFGHWGGIVHAGLQALGTIPVLWFAPLTPLAWSTIFIIAGIEFVVHYLIDWTKMNINRSMGWKSDNSENFWRLTGFDQFLHQMTYVVIAGWVYLG